MLARRQTAAVGAPGRARLSARHRGLAARRLCALAVLAALYGCGAGDQDATVVAVTRECKRAEALAPQLQAMAAAGELPTLQRVLGEQVLPDVRSELVRVLLEIVKSLPAGALDGLLALQERGAIDALGEPVVLLLDTVYATTFGPTGSTEVLAILDRLLFECPGQPLFETLAAQLRDPAFRANLNALLSAGLDLDALLLDLGIDVTALSARDGFAALFRSLLVLVASPDSSVDDLLGPGGLLAALVSPDDPVVTSALSLLRALLAPGPSLDAARGISQCVLAADSSGVVGRFLFDLVKADVLSALGALTSSELVRTEDVNSMIDAVVLPALDVVAADVGARRALVWALDALLQPGVAEGVLVDVRALVSRGVVGEAVRLLDALAHWRCFPRTDP